MAWDWLKLTAALIVLALLALVVLVNRREGGGRAPSVPTGERWHWAGPTKKAALIVVAVLGVVVLMSRLDTGGEKDRLEIWECRDKQGYSIPCPLPPGLENDPPGHKSLTVCTDEAGKYIRCPWLPADQGG